MLRNVGHLMTNPAILVEGEEVFEGIMDALATPLLTIADIRGQNENHNSRKGSMYIVKPKCMGLKKLLPLNYLSVLVKQLVYQLKRLKLVHG